MGLDISRRQGRSGVNRHKAIVDPNDKVDPNDCSAPKRVMPEQQLTAIVSQQNSTFCCIAG